MPILMLNTSEFIISSSSSYCWSLFSSSWRFLLFLLPTIDICIIFINLFFCVNFSFGQLFVLEWQNWTRFLFFFFLIYAHYFSFVVLLIHFLLFLFLSIPFISFFFLSIPFYSFYFLSFPLIIHKSNHLRIHKTPSSRHT